MGNQASALRPEVLTDLEESTAFNADEIREYYRNFLKECPEGRMSMSRDQFKKIYSKLFPTGDANQFAQHVFRTYDRDGNGRIDFREFLNSLHIQKRGTLEEKLTWLFKMYDIDGTGYITEDELGQMLKSLHNLRGKVDEHSMKCLANYILERADINKDKKLSLKEFLEGAKCSNTIKQMLDEAFEASTTPFRKS
ncbi:DgyrCDS10709 [Dimorphilus gyrociliatus]|uniref:DgyrCDS10709 n=1 Tax=Dimorphilus gyrociliatus TaxID=2664684 RepID=A0A7I8W152_9ANNE|nr:DgyrCDS10709 [Dimorphilus gyrociliatus]